MFIKNIFSCSMGGPFAVLMTYLQEFHNNKYRGRVMMCIGIMFSMASLSMPVLALMILPQKWEFNIFNMECKNRHMNIHLLLQTKFFKIIFSSLMASIFGHMCHTQSRKRFGFKFLPRKSKISDVPRTYIGSITGISYHILLEQRQAEGHISGKR